MIGKTILIYDVAYGSVRNPFIDEYEIEDFKAFEYIKLKSYPTKTYLSDKMQWDLLLEGKKAWIHPDEVFCEIIDL